MAPRCFAGRFKNSIPDRYKSFSTYAASKFGIFTAQRSYDTAIMNADDQEIMSRQSAWPSSRRLLFGVGLESRPGARIIDTTVVLQGCLDQDQSTEQYDLAGTFLELPHNTENGAAAILAARLMGCSPADIRKGLAGFHPLAHRMSATASRLYPS